MCFRLRVRPRCPLTRRLDSQTQQPLLSSLLDKLQEVKWGGKACSYYGFVNSHVLLSSTIQQVLKELESQLVGNLHSVVLLGRQVAKPVSNVLLFSSLQDYNEFLQQTYIQSPLAAENRYVGACSVIHDQSYVLFKEGTVSSLPYAGYVYDDKEVFALMATRYLSNSQIPVIDISEGRRGWRGNEHVAFCLYQEDENDDSCCDVKTAGYFVNERLVKKSTAAWARMYNEIGAAPSIVSADFRLSRNRGVF